MSARILFFGRLGEIAGGREFAHTPPAQLRNLGELRDWIAERDPRLGEALARKGVRAAINREFARDFSCAFSASDEIAFMSPLSGG